MTIHTKAEKEVFTVTKLVYGSTVQNPRAYHVVTTAAGFGNEWQARIHYYWFRKQREECLRGDGCDMGGFTRVLHTGKADALMDEVPTVVVDPLPSAMAADYIVLNRPYALQQWVERTSLPEKYFVMCETDHLFLRPMPNFMNGESQGAALFTYIVPWDFPKIVRKFIGDVSDEEIHKVPQIGNSPTFISREEFKALVPVWYNTTMEIFTDTESRNAWNWVLEMYGYSLATYRTGQHKNMVVVPNMLAHPPFDKEEVDAEGRPYYILHLTYPVWFDKDGNQTDPSTGGNVTWHFEKREYEYVAPPRGLLLPPPNAHNNLVRLMISMINEATDNIPCWDDYHATGKIRKCHQHSHLELATETQALQSAASPVAAAAQSPVAAVAQSPEAAAQSPLAAAAQSPLAAAAQSPLAAVAQSPVAAVAQSPVAAAAQSPVAAAAQSPVAAAAQSPVAAAAQSPVAAASSPVAAVESPVASAAVSPAAITDASPVAALASPTAEASPVAVVAGGTQATVANAGAAQGAADSAASSAAQGAAAAGVQGGASAGGGEAQAGGAQAAGSAGAGASTGQASGLGAGEPQAVGATVVGTAGTTGTSTGGEAKATA
ncbi:hypothetical protein HYH03_011768 [Edaphochlamys debaryana]|uniref:Hydroxyproline O-arabinosyltransferase-like domain-containing protein n=1 Tax=Edaphochlamys debaryana TaxID=47281 RepID=A0A836BW76_9CHLO|nr:hypothetical protein HYH03_011768 [Edaphochlamys debaryana]|eukprot:KAG2489819.1 hypothetical protein HYH03_011768 [Edaphochlamys debaryana]